MKIRSENTEVNERFTKLLTKRNDLRIGQMIYIALVGKRLYPALFGIEDEDLVTLIEARLTEIGELK